MTNILCDNFLCVGDSAKHCNVEMYTPPATSCGVRYTSFHTNISQLSHTYFRDDENIQAILNYFADLAEYSSAVCFMQTSNEFLLPRNNIYKCVQ
ncbi:unnamed protein product [Clavelina lepadiformis]|uniref:Uncharacterized protein n=1 Tax=Clavelina lepadiformis TaxID=159417 RepID=A0ABP0EZ45_CLALP